MSYELDAIAAVIIGKRVIRTKTGKMMAVLTLEDPYGRFEGVLFAGGQQRRGCQPALELAARDLGRQHRGPRQVDCRREGYRSRSPAAAVR